VAVQFHSAAEKWLYPYGYALNQYPDNVEEIVSKNKYCMFKSLALNIKRKLMFSARFSRSSCGSLNSSEWSAICGSKCC